MSQTNSASKVGEIFTAAGAAFTKLGELTMQLHPVGDGSSSGAQIKNSIKKKGDEGGLPCTVKKVELKLPQCKKESQQTSTSTNDMTLNMLNAAEAEIDVEELGGLGYDIS
ncbi:BPTF-associated chromatin complex component 1 isoform X2 [Tachypleus tridentatus]|uniref:BPTF-associated chromatin complex component 1 isoform X2 n=1 Tax=Tachypleus tridentatus TaxID=6853 RepID=UPI003FD2C889